jgi:hypothetical protein
MQPYVVPFLVIISSIFILALITHEILVARRQARDRTLLRECSSVTHTDELRYRRMARELDR